VSIPARTSRTPIAWVSARAGMPHRVARGGTGLVRDDVVHRVRHRRLLRQFWITTLWSRFWRRRSAITGSCG
jgi:hypothetical protein